MTIETRSRSAVTNVDMNLLSAPLERRAFSFSLSFFFFFFLDHFGESHRNYLKESRRRSTHVEYQVFKDVLSWES